STGSARLPTCAQRARPTSRRSRSASSRYGNSRNKQGTQLFMSSTGKLILVRHGQSVWNLENLFTGWTDVDLADQGREEATRAGRQLLDEKLLVDIAFTSVLKRAIRTLWIMLDEMDRMWVPVERCWRL